MNLPQHLSAPRLRRAAVACLSLALAALCLPVKRAEAGPTLLVDAYSGRVLHQSAAFEHWHPASLTKLMTTYAVLKAVKSGQLSLDSQITISELALSQAPSKMGFPIGTKVTVGDALKMLMVKSANDIAVALAEGVAGSVPDFAAQMNAYARALGMTDSHFTNPNGLPDPEQVTTARDLAVLALALIREFPDQADLFRVPSIRIGSRVLRNHNNLMRSYPGTDGMKTGYICSSGFNVVASATRGNKRLIAVVLGARNTRVRSEVAAALFEDGFNRTWSLFGLAGERLDSLQRPAATLSTATVDMRPVMCGPRRRGKTGMPPIVEPVPFDPQINLEVGRQALERGAESLVAVAVPVPVSAVMPTASSVAQELPSALVAEDEQEESPKPAQPKNEQEESPKPAQAKKKLLGKGPAAQPAAASAFAAPKPQPAKAAGDKAKPAKAETAEPTTVRSGAKTQAAEPTTVRSGAKPQAAEPTIVRSSAKAQAAEQTTVKSGAKSDARTNPDSKSKSAAKDNGKDKPQAGKAKKSETKS
ncbi:MAG: serine hydrolase [Pseudomonadota bacterium]|nr:serine hydrolase [Pseudomonadota bacterium]